MRPISGLAVGLAALALCVSAQDNPRGESAISLRDKTIVVEYGRPSLRGRDVLAIVATAAPWRLGADLYTTLRTEGDLLFGETRVLKGDYYLSATRTPEGQWLLHIRQRDAKKTPSADVPLSAQTLPLAVEMLTIELRGSKREGRLDVRWGTLGLSTPFTLPERDLPPPTPEPTPPPPATPTPVPSAAIS